MEWYVYKRTEAIAKRDLIKPKKGCVISRTFDLQHSPLYDWKCGFKPVFFTMLLRNKKAS